uniref:Uncharacterized protein n=1 Tax=Magallana gigas TaxID=29159 RepID=A0A8W8M063_MAGGI
MKPAVEEISASNIDVGAEAEVEANSNITVPDSITVLHDHEYATSSPQHNKASLKHMEEELVKLQQEINMLKLKKPSMTIGNIINDPEKAPLLKEIAEKYDIEEPIQCLMTMMHLSRYEQLECLPESTLLSHSTVFLSGTTVLGSGANNHVVF